MIPTAFYLILAGVIFTIGVLGVLIRRNVLIIFMCVEMMMNAVNLTFVALSRQFGTLDGQVFVFLIMAVAAAEVAIGLAIVLGMIRHKDTTNVDRINLLNG
jgi:NADH-quinone oxidoreductase subunit K